MGAMEPYTIVVLVLTIVSAFGLPALVIYARRKWRQRAERKTKNEFMDKVPPGTAVIFEGEEPRWLDDALKNGKIVRSPDGKGVMKPPFPMPCPCFVK